MATTTNALSTHEDPLLSNTSIIATSDPAPKFTINISSQNGSTSIAVLPDSGADISAAGEPILCHLNEHADHLIPSRVVPKAANGSAMHSIRKLSVTLKLGNKEFVDELHIVIS